MGKSSGLSLFQIAVAYGPLAAPAALVFIAASWPAWLFMWALAFAIFVACKWLTYITSDRNGVPWPRQAAYLFAWPGLDATAFLHESANAPRLGEWVLALVESFTGAALIWLVVPLVPAEWPLLRGWVGMIGIVAMLHFGGFLLLSCTWRTVGYPARPLMNWPIASTSVAEFWGQRWNTAFRDLTHRFVFRPLAKRFGPRSAMFIGFVLSGVVHDIVISIPANGGYGLPTTYFLIQGVALFLDRLPVGRQLGLGRGLTGCLFTAIVVAGPVPLLFHPPFVERVVVPFLAFLGAC